MNTTNERLVKLNWRVLNAMKTLHNPHITEEELYRSEHIKVWIASDNKEDQAHEQELYDTREIPATYASMDAYVVRSQTKILEAHESAGDAKGAAELRKTISSTKRGIVYHIRDHVASFSDPDKVLKAYASRIYSVEHPEIDIFINYIKETH